MLERTLQRIVLGCCLWLASGFALADTLRVLLLMDAGARLELNGKTFFLKVGETSSDGLELLSSSTESAQVRYQGQTRELKVGREISTQFKKAELAELRLATVAGGHYLVRGKVNGKITDMMIDTGATSVAMNRHHAARLGISYRDAPRVPVSTASGQAVGYAIQLESVTTGDIQVFNVKAIIIDADFPEIILLGNSFLTRVDMQVDNGVMILRSRT